MPKKDYIRHPHYGFKISVEEEWRDVVGYERLDQVSNQGRVRSLKRECRIIDFHGQENKRVVPGKMMAGSPDYAGYLLVTLHKNMTQRIRKIHQLVLEGFADPRPQGLVARHLNGNKSNNRFENLCWGTSKQNSRDRIEHGRSPKGVANAGRCLNQNAANAMRVSRKRGTRVIELARQFRVSTVTVMKVLSGKIWTGLPKKSRKGISQNGGASNGNSVLAEPQVVQMREEWDANKYRSYSELGRRYGVSSAVAARVIKRLSYINVNCRRVPGTGS